MKKISISLLSMLFMATYVHSQSALEYMDEMTKDMKGITESIWEYVSATAHGNNAKKVDKKRLEVLDNLSASKSRISALPGFNGNSTYRDAVIKYLDISYAIFNDDYAKLVDMEAIAEESYDAMEAYMLTKERANDKLKEAADEMGVAEENFANENNINLVDPEKDKISKNLEISNLVYDHYNEVYLVFFKSYKQEFYLLEAIKKNDINATEQNRNALISSTTEGIDKLKNMKGYNNDATIIISCKKLLEFYKSEAENDIPTIQDFLLKTEYFEKVKASFESKAEKDRTKTDVDKYNEAVNSYNESLNKTNKVYETTNTNRSKYLNDWNKSVDTYLDKQVPK